MTRIFWLSTALWLAVTPACGNRAHELDGGVDAGCQGDLAGSDRQVCGVPDATFDPMTCSCQGDQ